MLSINVDPRTADEANQIYVFGRLAHHLVFHRFAWRRMMSFGLLLIIWIALWSVARKSPTWSRLNRFAFASLMISCVGVILDVALLNHPQLAASLLKFYWFRLSDVALPLAVALAVPVVIRRLSEPHASDSRASDSRHPAGTLGLDRDGGRVRSVARLEICSVADRFSAASDHSVATRWPSRCTTHMYDRYRAWRNACAWIARQTTAPQPIPDTAQPADVQVVRWPCGSGLLEGHSARCGERRKVVAFDGRNLHAGGDRKWAGCVD